jgi:hypothetical protein
MNNFLKLSCSLLFLIPCLGTAPLWADSDWSFLPASTVFKPLIGDPREPVMGLVGYLNQVNYEGQVGATLELIRYTPDDDYRFGWGIFASGYILLGEDGATFPMLDGDFYIGTYLSANLGVFSARIEALHESTHLGDSFQGSQQVPLFFNNDVTYTRENVNGTLSFYPSEFLRLYAGAGIWDKALVSGYSSPLFTSFGTEIYSPSWAIDHSSMCGYLTGSLQWKGEEYVWDTEVQLGIQWKAFKTSARAIRIAILYYNGDSQFGQFYNVPDTHWGLATFFDF